MDRTDTTCEQHHGARRMRRPATVVTALVLLVAAAGDARARDAGARDVNARARVVYDTVVGRMVMPLGDDAPVAATTSPRTTYVLHCSGCHGMDGAGSARGRVPELRRVGAFLHLPGGRDYVLKVPGLMGSGLDDAQVAAVMNWVLANLARDSMPLGQPPYRTDEVARARAAPLKDVAAERRRLLGEARVAGVTLY